MKRILLALVIASATMLSFNSCTKEYIEDPRTDTFSYTINPQDWTNNNTPAASVSIDVPELSDNYVDFGLVSMSMSNNNRETFNKLPATIQGISYNYEYTTGRITIYAEDPINDNFNVQIDRTLILKVSLTQGR
ncbi:hypothetical protein [Sphingobacterium corticibacter]|uniref:DUF1735 domain-containing protein n=1 Tax=Sphingobacterium corticibacter TaxID=2171749 RepID=A0A2T8HG76_9SPHI|nr:hypothetical protein [Sphingobacterium corticibacter]PVH24413.1 hypothetical protein DC487_15140 [Sphingobacterium corticibacter]